MNRMCRREFKEFYNLNKETIEGMSLVKNKILFAGNLGS
jgi:hypothetical protein